MTQNSMIKTDNSLQRIDVLNSEEYKRLPVKKQLEIAQYIAQKNADLNSEQRKYLLDHMSCDHDTVSYLKFLEEQNRINENAKGVTVSYNSHETQSPTGKITSRTTHATAASGCLLPTIGFVFIMMAMCFI